MKRTLLRNIFSDEGQKQNKKLKLIEDRVNVVEKFVPDFKNKVRSYNSKKDAEKKILWKTSNVLTDYANAEVINTSLKISANNFARILTELVDHEETLVRDLEENVCTTLDDFGKRCKFLNNDIKSANNAADNEMIRQRQYQRLEMLRDQDHEKVSLAQAELLRAKSEHSKAIQTLEEHADLFEHQKLQGLRTSLLEWATIELRYHARALELFTDAYQVVADIDVNGDLEKYRDKVHNAPFNDQSATTNQSMTNYRNVTPPRSLSRWSLPGNFHRSSAASSVGH